MTYLELVRYLQKTPLKCDIDAFIDIKTIQVKDYAYNLNKLAAEISESVNEGIDDIFDKLHTEEEPIYTDALDFKDDSVSSDSDFHPYIPYLPAYTIAQILNTLAATPINLNEILLLKSDIKTVYILNDVTNKQANKFISLFDEIDSINRQAMQICINVRYILDAEDVY